MLMSSMFDYIVKSNTQATHIRKSVNLENKAGQL